ncbi:MAG: acyl-CoA carboxylase subunit beta [Nocardiopsaceae bacterium]|nr:acyl-CoA carboxylase subunit beta [Nocardiopsaceae bacterium]
MPPPAALARELVDAAATLEPLSPPGDEGAFAAIGTVSGIPAVVFASDPAVKGGAMGQQGCALIVRAYERALAVRCPIIGLWHSGGARLAEGVRSLQGVGSVFAAMTRASGEIPQISVVLGPAAGGAAYGPALTDIVICAPEGRIFVTGPDVVRSVTGEDVDALSLGGPDMHSRRSGVVHIVTPDRRTASRMARQAAALLGNQGSIELGLVEPRSFAGLLPVSPRRAYDVRPLIACLLDAPGLELLPKWGPNVVTSLGRLGGRTIGVIANNPLRLAGCLDCSTAEKAARFVRMCDAFGIPLVVLVDVPGYLPGLTQEAGGVVRRGAKLLHAFAEAVVPRVTLVTRKAYGGAYVAMNSHALGATKVYAWPGAEIAVMNAVSAVRILHRRHLQSISPELRSQTERELAAEHDRSVGGIGNAIGIGVVDEVISPDQTRMKIAQAIAEAPCARGKHTNIPL